MDNNRNGSNTRAATFFPLSPRACAECNYALLQSSSNMPVHSDTAYIQPYLHFLDAKSCQTTVVFQMSSVPLFTSLVYNIWALVQGQGGGITAYHLRCNGLAVLYINKI